MKTLAMMLVLLPTLALANPCRDALDRFAAAERARYHDDNANTRAEVEAAGADVDYVCQGRGPDD